MVWRKVRARVKSRYAYSIHQYTIFKKQLNNTIALAGLNTKSNSKEMREVGLQCSIFWSTNACWRALSMNISCNLITAYTSCRIWCSLLFRPHGPSSVMTLIETREIRAMLSFRRRGLDMTWAKIILPRGTFQVECTKLLRKSGKFEWQKWTTNATLKAWQISPLSYALLQSDGLPRFNESKMEC